VTLFENRSGFIVVAEWPDGSWLGRAISSKGTVMKNAILYGKAWLAFFSQPTAVDPVFVLSWTRDLVQVRRLLARRFPRVGPIIHDEELSWVLLWLGLLDRVHPSICSRMMEMITAEIMKPALIAPDVSPWVSFGQPPPLFWDKPDFLAWIETAETGIGILISEESPTS